MFRGLLLRRLASRENPLTFSCRHVAFIRDCVANFSSRFKNLAIYQCSVFWSVRFWASRIRIGNFLFGPVLRIRDVRYIADANFFHPIPNPGTHIEGQKYSGSRIPRIQSKKSPDPEPGSASKNLSIVSPKNCFQALGNIIRDVHPGSGSWFLTHPGSRIQRYKRHRIQIHNTDSGSDSESWPFHQQAKN